MKIYLIIIVAILLTGCSPKSFFPTDNKEYNSPQKYEYDYVEHNFSSTDKTTLYGLHIKPKAESLGLVVVVNGMYENMSARFPLWLWVVDNGYELFTFDYRGYGKSNKEADLYGFRDDVASALEYAHTLSPEKKIIVVGQSMGGTLVIDTLAMKKYDYISLAVIDSTFTSFSAVLKHFMLKSIILIPWSWLPGTFTHTDLNSIENVQYINTPTLFITGDNDWVVEYENSIMLYEKSACNKALWILEGGGHVQSFLNNDVRLAFLKLLKKKSISEKDRERFF